MISLLFFSLIILGVCDPLIRRSKNSTIKNFWVKIIKKPIFQTIEDYNNKIAKKIINNYSDNKGMIDTNKVMDRLSEKYLSILLIIGVSMLLISILSFFI